MAVRKNVSSSSVVTKFVKGIKALKQNGQYDKFIQSHYSAMSSVHRTPAFLPWHRAYLMDFESKLQTALGDTTFGLPYWDFAADATKANNRGVLWTGGYLGGAGSPVPDGPFANNWPIYSPDGRAVSQLTRRLAGTGTFPTTTKTQELFKQATYDGFRRALEGDSRAFHDWLHPWVGGPAGQMSSVANSPNDPAFWLLHCNIDRIWAQWQRIRPMAKVEAAVDKNFGPAMMMPATYDGTGARTVGSVLDAASTTYSYDAYYGNSTPLVVRFWTSKSLLSGTDNKVELSVGLRRPDVDPTTPILAGWSEYLDAKYCDHPNPLERGQVDTFTFPNVVFTPKGTEAEQTPVCFLRIGLYLEHSFDPLGGWTVAKVQVNSDGAVWNADINKTLTIFDNQAAVFLGPPVF